MVENWDVTLLNMHKDFEISVAIFDRVIAQNLRVNYHGLFQNRYPYSVNSVFEPHLKSDILVTGYFDGIFTAQVRPSNDPVRSFLPKF